MDERAKHTPGPWELCTKGDYGDFDGNSRVIIGDDRRLAVVHVSDEETDANARLIAAAPLMLAALDEISLGAGPFNQDPMRHAENTIENMKELARNAIREATEKPEMSEGA
jgi:hypothetical protein